jgi:hypothetical protein
MHDKSASESRQIYYYGKVTVRICITILPT